MTFVAIVSGLVLVILGALALLFSGWASAGAFLPIFIGVLWVALGFVGERREERDVDRRRFALYGATAVALVGFFLTFSSLQAFLGVLGGDSAEYLFSTIAQAVTALACLTFILLELRTFVGELEEKAHSH